MSTAGAMIVLGDARQMGLADNSIDAIVTDPPYGLEFMGKEWDKLGWSGDGTGARAKFGPVNMPDGAQRLPRPSYYGGGQTTCRKCGGDKYRQDLHSGGIQRKRCKCEAPEFLNIGAIRGKRMQTWHHSWAIEALRVLKPGGHLLAMGGTRTFHRLTCALEDAGFEIRDTIMWMYGSGFPKSYNISKGFDRRAFKAWLDTVELDCCLVRDIRARKARARKAVSAAVGGVYSGLPDIDGARRTKGHAGISFEIERPWIEAKRAGTASEGSRHLASLLTRFWEPLTEIERHEIWQAIIGDHEGCDVGMPPGVRVKAGISSGPNASQYIGERYSESRKTQFGTIQDQPISTAPSTPLAKEWEGFGSGLKPAFEPIVVARKPLIGTLCENAEKFRVGGFNIIDSRIPSGTKGMWLDYAEQIVSYVGNINGDNSACKGQKHYAIALHRNFDKVFASFLHDAYPLGANEASSAQNPNYRKLSDFLGDCPACLRLCDALVHLVSKIGLTPGQLLDGVHKYIHLSAPWDGLGSLPLHSHPIEYSDHLSNLDFCCQPIDQSGQPRDYAEEYQHYLKYAQWCLESNHTCVPTGLCYSVAPSDILDKSAFLSLCQNGNSNVSSLYTSIKFVVPLIISQIWGKVKYQILRQGRWPANLILSHSEGCVRVGTKRAKGSFRGFKTSQKFALKGYGYENAGSIPAQAGYADPDGYEKMEDWICVESCPVRLLDEQGGVTQAHPSDYNYEEGHTNTYGWAKGGIYKSGQHYGDKGGSSRFFKSIEPDKPLRFCYAAKASRSERTCQGTVENKEPTVKPVNLCRYLERLVARPRAVILDPFCGSGSFGVAAILEGFNWIGIDNRLEACQIAKKRHEWAIQQNRQPRLFK